MLIKYMLGKASTGKFRYAVVECDCDWHEPEHGYIIQRSYGQVQGKNTLSPAIIVDRTKQKRTWKEQYILQFNSEVKKFLDKGYVEVEKHPNDYELSELEEIFGEVKTNQRGVIKPQLAKQSEKVAMRGDSGFAAYMAKSLANGAGKALTHKTTQEDILSISS